QPTTEQLIEDLITSGVKPPPDSTREILLAWHTTNCTNIVHSSLIIDPPSTKLSSVAQQQQQRQLMNAFHDVFLPPCLTSGRSTTTTPNSTMLNGSHDCMLQLAARELANSTNSLNITSTLSKHYTTVR
ncbi:unnamed protein product, partial [Didymodactylos carnosus]